MPSVGFWELAGCLAISLWFFSHIEGHLRAMRRDPTITLNPIFSGAIWFYHWFAWCPWIVPLYYTYKTVWWHGVVLAVAGLVLRFFISIVEGGLKLQRNAWAISLIGLLVIPILSVASLVVLEHSTGTTDLFEHCKVCGL